MHSASRSNEPLNITRAPTPKANLNARVNALCRRAAVITSCIVLLTLWPSGRRTDSSLGDVYA